jgi:heme exporter protein D
VSSLVWLAIPLVALVLAVLWVVWTSRTRPRADTHETLEEHARFKAAMDPERYARPDRPGRSPGEPR